MRSHPVLLPQSNVSRAGWVEFAQSVRDLLKQERIAVEDVAIVLGVSVATARTRWNGHTPWKLDELLAVASLVDRPLSHLLLDYEIQHR